MKTIVFAASKGGTGKSTLCWNIAHRAAQDGTVFAVDMDPQHSLTTLFSIRERHVAEPENNPMLLSDVATVGKAVAHLNKSGFARDFLIVDLPGSNMNAIGEAMINADAVVLPVQASALDILAQEDCFKAIGYSGKAPVTVFVLNRADGRCGFEDVYTRLGKIALNPMVRINQRQAYPRSVIKGQTATEYDLQCADEINALWDAIRAILKKGDK